MTPTTSPERESNELLAGIRVIDLTAVVLGPLATQQLADLGADVIKIEPPEGDMMRANGMSKRPGMSSIHLGLNRNKRSVVLDLKSEAARHAMRKLIEGADVFVHNMRVPAIERLGFGYDAVRAINPSIVYCAAVGFGQDGPDHDKPAFDDIIQSGCGLTGLSGTIGATPSYLPSLVADKVTGMALAQAILAALLRRARTGRGAHVEVPMLETMTVFTLAEHMGNLAFADRDGPAGYARLLEGGRRVVPTSDGHVSMLPYTPQHWIAFLEAVGRTELVDRFGVRTRAGLNANIKSLYDQLIELGPARRTAEWVDLCTRLDIPVTPVYRLDDLPRHPHLAAVGLFEVSEHPTEGLVRQLRPATVVDGRRLAIRNHAPSLGEHTVQILQEAGLSASEINSCVPHLNRPSKP